MDYTEIIKDMQDSFELDQQNARESYLQAESTLAERMCQYVMNAEITSPTYGEGCIVKASGITFDSIVIEIAFAEVTKKFSLANIIVNTRFVQFKNEEYYEPLTSALNLHSTMTATYKEYELVARQARIEAEKRADAEQKAEAKYLEHKEKALKDFDNLVQQARNNIVVSHADEFYYALGWLTKHIGTLSATLPDYLEADFAKYFGEDTPRNVVDSKKRSPAGWQQQWSWFFKASLKKVDMVPSAIRQYLNPTGKALTSTSFIWDLIDNYGFQFGKKQDVEKITQTIPAKYIEAFNEGLTA